MEIDFALPCVSRKCLFTGFPGHEVTTLLFTGSDRWLLLPVIANIAATIGGYTYNTRKIRIIGRLINLPLWIVYDIAVGSRAGILDEIVSEGSMAIFIFRYGWKKESF